MPAISRDAILYDAIQRIYRPCVIGYIRRQLTTAYGTAAVRKLEQHLGTETWQKARHDSERSRASGVIQGSARDDFDLLDVTNLHVIIQNEFDALFPSQPSDTPEGRKDRRSALVGWARIVRSARNPLSHPVEDEIASHDAVGCIATARLVVSQIDAGVAQRLSDVIDQLSAPVPRPALARTTAKMVWALPPSDVICAQFVGRDHQLLALSKWLDDPDQRRHVLAGSGGKGKTAIAYEFARRVRDTPPQGLDGVIWLSAKQRAFIDGDTHDVPYADFRTLDDAARRILQVLDREQASLLDEASRQRAVLEALSDLRCLVVIDDVDTLAGHHEEVHDFFLGASYTTQSKFLFTSRRKLHGLGSVTSVVPGLENDDGLMFIATRVDMYGLQAEQFTPERCARILAVTEGTPLYIDELMRFVAAEGSIDRATRQWSTHGGEKAREYSLIREVELLSRQARLALIAAALPDQSVSAAELRVVTGFTEDELASGVAELSKLFLVPRRSLLEANETFQLELNTRALVRTVAERAYPDDLRHLVAARQQIIGSKAARRRPFGEFVTQAAFLARSKRWLESEQVLQAGMEAFPEQPELLAQLGLLYRAVQPPRFGEARAAFQRAHDLGSRDLAMHRGWLRMELQAEQLTLAVRLADTCVTRCSPDRDLWVLVASTFRRHGRQLAAAGSALSGQRLEAAALHLEVALRLPSTSGSRRSQFDDASIYLELCGAMRDLVAIDAQRPSMRSEWRSRLAKHARTWATRFPRDARAKEFLDSKGRSVPTVTHHSSRPASLTSKDPVLGAAYGHKTAARPLVATPAAARRAMPRVAERGRSAVPEPSDPRRDGTPADRKRSARPIEAPGELARLQPSTSITPTVSVDRQSFSDEAKRSSSTPSNPPNLPGTILVGQRIRHAIFGFGVVVRVLGSARDPVLEISFSGGAPRQFVASTPLLRRVEST